MVHIQDSQWEGIDPGGKSLYCIHDQNKLSRDKIYNNRHAF